MAEADEADCCADNWAVWTQFETWIWAVLLLVQVSMVVFLAARGRTDKSLRQAFYVLFIAVTVVDCVLVIWRPSSRQLHGTIFGTQYDYTWTTETDPWTNHTRYYPTTRAIITDVALVVIVPVFVHAQPLFLTAIAVNRFTAICFPLKHADIWRARRVAVVAIILSVISVILGVGCPVAIALNQVVKCARASREAGEELYCDAYWAFAQADIPLALMSLTSAFCCMISFALNVGSVTMLLMIRRTAHSMPRKGLELQLFAHSLYTFLLQILLAFQDLVYVADNIDFLLDNLEIDGFSWAYYRHSSEWLAGVEATRTWTNGKLNHTLGCKKSEGKGPPVPLCAVWYRLLIGELRLREGTKEAPEGFSVRTLCHCLLALSGSVFLLLINGNVRKAYFKFYFNCKALQRKRTQQSSVNVLPAATYRRAQARSSSSVP